MELARDRKNPDADGRITIVYRWVGPGWSPGIPARDLTADDVTGLDPEIWATALALGIYEEAP